MSILEKIVKQTKMRVEKLKKNADIAELKQNAKKMQKGDFPFEKVLKKDPIAFICEIKKASPSKGIIAEDFPYLEIAKEYESAGADAISVLTEPDFFLGDIKYLEEIASSVNIPILRKDFIIDEIQIYESKIKGASAILLICSVLDDKVLDSFIKVADNLGLSCLVEAHNEEEITKAIKAKARIIGINNRDLKTFNVDITNAIKHRNLIPDDILFVSESGIKTYNQIKSLTENKVNAVLIGEVLMKAKDRKSELNKLRGKNQ